jgi:hypothetical protein
MDALDMHIEKRVWIEHDSQSLPDELGERDFVRPACAA